MYGRRDWIFLFLHCSLNRTKRQRELLRITHENLAILKRITSKEPHYNHLQWIDDWEVRLVLFFQEDSMSKCIYNCHTYCILSIWEIECDHGFLQLSSQTSFDVFSTNIDKPTLRSDWLQRNVDALITTQMLTRLLSTLLLSMYFAI